MASSNSSSIVAGTSKINSNDSDDLDISIDAVDDKFYIGNLKAACDVKTLNKHEITHILTVDSIPLPRVVLDRAQYTFKYVQLSDISKEDLITHLPDTNQFIDETLTTGGCILVHCYFGMSRSASVVISYIMWKYGFTYEDALARLKSKRSVISPNFGFEAQLKLYKYMNCRIDKNNARYKQFRLRMAGDKLRKVKILPQEFSDLIKPDPSLTMERPDPRVYRCKKCRRIVATHHNIIPHIPKPLRLEMQMKSSKNSITRKTSTIGNRDELMKKLNNLTDNVRLKDLEYDNSSDPDMHLVDAEIVHNDLPEICKEIYFVEPMCWMRDVNHNIQGKLNCPKCSNKIGSFSWTMGCRCPCGQKVAPAFYLVPSKVEYSDIVQNVQRTI